MINRKGTDIPPHMSGKMHIKMRECLDINKHEYGPDGYGDSVDWANNKMKTHEQLQCICGFYVIWKKKENVSNKTHS